MKKKLFDYLLSIGFVKSNLPVYQLFTKGTPQQCLVFPKGRLNNNTLITTRHHMVAWGYLTEQEFDREFAQDNASTKSIGMRKLILMRIEELRQSYGFSPTSSRWVNLYHVDTSKQKKIHISELDFNICSDEELLQLFETIIKFHYKQM